MLIEAEANLSFWIGRALTSPPRRDYCAWRHGDGRRGEFYRPRHARDIRRVA